MAVQVRPEAASIKTRTAVVPLGFHIVINTIARAVIASNGGIGDGDEIEDRLWTIPPHEGIVNSFC